jgi:hypothetical protein
MLAPQAILRQLQGLHSGPCKDFHHALQITGGGGDICPLKTRFTRLKCAHEPGKETLHQAVEALSPVLNQDNRTQLNELIHQARINLMIDFDIPMQQSAVGIINFLKNSKADPDEVRKSHKLLQLESERLQNEVGRPLTLIRDFLISSLEKLVACVNQGPDMTDLTQSIQENCSKLFAQIFAKHSSQS